MFAMLQRQAKEPSKTTGSSMKFQYGSGDQPLDGYTIKRGVGVGGFGEVYFAESDSGKEVALKRIQKNLDVEMRGVRHCLNLRHTNLVGIYDIRFDREDQGWIVMEFIEGESLRERMDHEPSGMPPAQTMQLFAQIVAGCTYLHDQGIVHRDLKPANIFIENGLAKIGDYGLSKFISASRRGGQTESVGTFHYMAPEIGRGEYGKEIDIYSLGIILYEMLSGNVPFDGESTQEIILKHLTADPDLSTIAQPYASVIQKALAKNPVQRFRDGRDMLAALGYAIDASGLAVRTSFDPTANFDAATHQPSPPLGGHAPFAGFGSQPASPSSSGMPVGFSTAVPLSGPQPSLNDRINLFFRVGIDGHAEALKNEPLLQWFLKFVKDMGLWSKTQTWDRKDGNWWRTALIITALVFVVLNSAWIAPSLIVVGWSYLMYYVVWFLSVGWSMCGVHPLQNVSKTAMNQTPRRGMRYVKHGTTAAAVAGLSETIHYENDARPSVAGPAMADVVKPAKPISSKEGLRLWQKHEREALSRQGFWTRAHAVTRSMTVAGFIATVLTVGGGFLAMANTQFNSKHWVGGIAWLGVMTVATSWVILAFSRRWESRSEDSIVFRFVLMAAGLLLGALSYQTSEYLMVPWGQLSSDSGVQFELFDGSLNRSWKGFYDANGVPMLAGHMAFFAGMMWILRWWRQSDILRRKRFSLWTIVWSVLLVALVQGIFYFPGPWHTLLALGTSLVVQLASPWTEPMTARKVA